MMNDYAKKLQEICPSFEPKEILSPQGLYQLSLGNLMLQEEALSALEQFRQVVKVPIKINHGELLYRGYRSPEENHAIGGAQLSRQCQGIAFDCTPIGMSLEDFYSHALAFGWGGVGYYPKKNFVHVDYRSSLGKRATWRLEE